MGSILRAGRKRLADGGLAEARLEAEVLLMRLVGVSRAHLHSHLDDPVSEGDEVAYRSWLDRRAAREPLAYITGMREFFGLDLYVDRRVLIPRPETELLVEECLRLLERGRTGPSAPTQDGGTSIPTGEGGPSIPVGEGGPPAPTRLGGPFVPMGDGGPSTPTRDGVPSAPTGDGAWYVAMGDGGPSVPARDDGQSVPARDGGPSAPTRDGGPSAPTQDGGTSIPTGGGSPSISVGEGGPSVPARDGGPSIARGGGSPSISVGEGGPSVPARDGGPSIARGDGRPSVPTGERRPFPVLADIGAGSGAIAVALACQLPDARIHATDVSPAALEVAYLNCVRHGVQERVELKVGDLLEPLEEPVDVVLANLPYIADPVLPTLAPEVSVHEPRLALAGGADGLDLVRRLLEQAPGRLRPGGRLLLEIGSGQGEKAARAAAEALPGSSIRVMRDLAGLERMLVIELD